MWGFTPGETSLPDHLRTDVDGPSCSDDEKGAKRLRSTSTTPRSVRGTDPDDYDRTMGVTSVGSRETVRFGAENDPEIEENLDGVIQNNGHLEIWLSCRARKRKKSEK